MAITRDQASPVVTAGGTSGAVTWTVNPQAGSKVLIAMSSATKLIPTSVVDNGTTPRTFILDASYTAVSRDVFIYRADNITLPSAGSYTVTVTWPSANGGATYWGQSYLGVAAGAPTSTNNGTATSGAVATGSVTPSAAGALFFAAFVDASAQNPETITLTGTGFTNAATQTNGSTHLIMGFADKIDAAGPAATPCTWTLGDAPLWQAVIAVYDAAAVAGGILPQQARMRHPAVATRIAAPSRGAVYR